MTTTQDQDEFIDFSKKIEEEYSRHIKERAKLEEFRDALRFIPENLTRVSLPFRTVFVSHGDYGLEQKHNSVITGIGSSCLDTDDSDRREKVLDFLALIPNDLVLLEDTMLELFRVRFDEFTNASGYMPLSHNYVHRERLYREENNQKVTNFQKSAAFLYIHSHRRYTKPDIISKVYLEDSRLELIFWCQFRGRAWAFYIQLPDSLFLQQLIDNCEVDYHDIHDNGHVHRHVWSFASVSELIHTITFGFSDDRTQLV